MHRAIQQVYLIRHGETQWSLSGQHTGHSDIPLTENGRRLAGRLQPVLAREMFDLVLTSPLQRSQETCDLAGLGTQAQIDPDLIEWDYGEYEGLTSEQIHETDPNWMLFRDGAPGGENTGQVSARVDRLIAKVRVFKGNVAMFAHGHLFRVFVSRWLGFSPDKGSHFLLDTATLNILSYYQGIPAMKCWNAPLLEDSV